MRLRRGASRTEAGKALRLTDFQDWQGRALYRNCAGRRCQRSYPAGDREVRDCAGSARPDCSSADRGSIVLVHCDPQLGNELAPIFVRRLHLAQHLSRRRAQHLVSGQTKIGGNRSIVSSICANPLGAASAWQTARPIPGASSKRAGSLAEARPAPL